MVRSITTKARDAITNAAQRSVKGVTSIAGDVLGAAAQAAADVVLESTTNALEAGRAKIKQSTPAMKRAIRKAAKRTVSTPVQKTTVAKRKTTNNRKAKRRSRQLCPRAYASFGIIEDRTYLQNERCAFRPRTTRPIEYRRGSSNAGNQMVSRPLSRSWS
jgi:hypothetical protein